MTCYQFIWTDSDKFRTGPRTTPILLIHVSAAGPMQVVSHALGNRQTTLGGERDRRETTARQILSPPVSPGWLRHCGPRWPPFRNLI